MTKVLHNLNVQAQKLKHRGRKGIIRAALFIKRDSQQRVPVDQGNLKASAFALWGAALYEPAGANSNPAFKSAPGVNVGKLATDHTEVLAGESAQIPSDEIAATVGYSAFYALFVHEMDEAGKSPVEVGEAKFLQHSLEQNTHHILALIAEEAKI